MENLSHSRQPNIVSKRSCNGSTNKFTYDDVFGGPPKFGAPTLSPRVEDYSEIFGGFHESRASSIPVLDLPLACNEVAEVFFDVRSSGFDYREVFGGVNGHDFAVSYEELFMMDQSNGFGDSSDEAWTPAEAENLSEELDHSAKDQCLSNGDLYDSVDGGIEFDIAYNKAGQRSNEDLRNGITHMTQLHDVSGYTFVVDKSTSLPKTDYEYQYLLENDDYLNMDCSGEMLRGRQLRKVMSHPVNGSTDGLFENDFGMHREFVRNGSLPNETFVTISDVSLKTRPSHLPPPFRPPPALEVKKEDYAEAIPNCKNVASEETAGDSSPRYFDVEVDASSSAAASAASLKEAMEKAQSKLKSAKESMERKREGFQTRKSGSKKGREDKVEKVTKIVSGSDSRQDDRGQNTSQREDNGMEFSILEEKQKVKMTSQPISDSLEGKKHLNVAKRAADENHGRESLSSQGSDRIAGAGEWKEATQFFEWEVNEKRHKETREREENEKRLREAREREENEKRLREAREREENEKRLREAREREENEKRLREAREREENERKQREAREREENENERKQREAREREENDEEETQREARREREENEEENLEKSCATGERDWRRRQRGSSRKERKMEEEARRESFRKGRKMMRRQRERLAKEEEGKEENEGKAAGEENERKQREAFEREENERRQREAREREESERRVREAREREESERRQREARERDEIEKRLKEALEKEENEKRLKETLEKEERRREAAVREENAKKEREACERNDKRFKEALQKEENETILKVDVEQEENDKRLGETHEREENEKKQREDRNVSDQSCKLDDDKNSGATQLTGMHEGNNEKLESAKEFGLEETSNRLAKQRNSEKEVASGIEHDRSQVVTKDLTSNEQKTIENVWSTFQVDSDAGDQGKKFAYEKCDIGKNFEQTQVPLNQGNKDNFVSARIVKESVEMGRKLEGAQPAILEVKGSTHRMTQQVNASQSIERKVKNSSETLSSECKDSERMKRERDLEMERLRKIEEEREREREREKDRMAVDRATMEMREKAYVEARERAERAAVERATAEARQRALNEARERLEKACADAREKSDKASMEARFRAERAAVERATAEARERAFEKAVAERATFEARERVERSVSDKFSVSSRNSGMRPSSSTSDLQDMQYQGAGSLSGSRYQYSMVYNERSEAVEGESAQRCKARLERYRRTSERAAKALAEKNMRDLLAQREQAERNRLAETLDADVKRWSSGKEGNLRALLSTLQYILGPDSGWRPIPLTEVITAAAVKKAYRKATLCVHPDKLQQRGASIQQKYICEKVFDLLKEGWNKFNSEER
ncbi:auxilin-related protein 1 [Jatropha curcas]|uniref:auxilin-related protein 1 n=1 Tax=Jatropha curcas TaxID=180498 RepID=UPI00189629AD|nr:auxilin-related protein 1 [Jatropha curcas]